MADINKRLHYFDHQFLRANDFNDEQSYHVNRLRIHNRALHTPGIAEGLKVIFEAGATSVVVQKGTAVDGEGQLILLTDDHRVELGDQPADAPVYVTIAYNETQTDISKESDVHDNTRWTEEPDIRDVTKKPDNPSMQLILALVKRAGTIVSEIVTTDRRAAGAASGDITTRMLTLMREGIDPNKWPHLSCTDVNQAGLENSSLRIDDGREIFFRDKGQIRSLDNAHRIVFNRPANRLEFYEFGDISFNTGNPQTEKLKILASGNVGIGAPAAADKLEVAGTLRILTGSNPIRFTSGWSDFPAGALNQSEISNDTVNYKTLMIIGNRSNEAGVRRVSVWDRLEVNGTLLATGNVQANANLQVNGNLTVNGAFTPNFGNATDKGIYFPPNPGGGAGDEAFIRYFATAGETTMLRIGIGNDPTDTINFWQAGADKLVIGNGGIGIGTPDPDRALTIQGGAGTYMNIKTTNNEQQILVGADGGGGIVSTMTAHDLQLRAGSNTTKVWIKANGNVGIGTATPDAKLDVNGAIRAGNSDIYFTDANHAHSGIGNAEGWAAIENAKNYNALMILGRTVPNVGRVVALWDVLNVNGTQTISGNLGTHGFPATPKTSGWGGGVHTWDVEAEGSIWARQGSQAGPRDLAENYLSPDDLSAGDVVCLALDRDAVVLSERPNDTLVLGVISTKPGLLLNSTRDDEDYVKDLQGMLEYPLALSGRVPCKVTDENGPIKRGDFLTSSSTRGHAMKAQPVKIDGVDIYRPGTVIGKALESFKSGRGMIEVFVFVR